MTIARRRFVGLTVITLLSLAAGLVWRHASDSQRASAHPFDRKFYFIPTPLDGIHEPNGINQPGRPATFDDTNDRLRATDLFGNNIATALAIYAVDPSGMLVDLLSPQEPLRHLREAQS